MRIHKYRAWDKREKKMIYPSADDHDELIYNFSSGEFLLWSDVSWYSAKHLILLEYTSLKDRNNVEIYEGDIVKCDNAGNREVFFDDASYFTKNKFKGKKSVHFLTNDPKYYEVIGNIYENPKLLKKT